MGPKGSKSSTDPKGYIITTGDSSDYDGFTSLPLYKKIAAKKGYDVVFIMNYPAFFQYPDGDVTIPINADAATYKRSSHGGYEYGATEFYQMAEERLGTVGTPNNPTPYLPMLAGSWMDIYARLAKVLDKKGKKDEPFTRSNLAQMRIVEMTFTAFSLARSIWNNCNVDSAIRVPNLIFCIGGINTFNGFGIANHKEEIYVYKDIVEPMSTLAHVKRFVTRMNDSTSLSFRSFMKRLGTKEMYIDMNGSMAFYESGMFKKQNVKAVAIMGGMPQGTPCELSTIPPFLSRPKCTSFNQLYHPVGTLAFIKDMMKAKVPIYLTTNPECNRIIGYTNLVKKLDSEDGKAHTQRAGGVMLHALVEAGIFKSGGPDYKAYKKFLTVEGAAPTVFDLANSYMLASLILNPETRKARDDIDLAEVKLVIEIDTFGVMTRFITDPDTSGEYNANASVNSFLVKTACMKKVPGAKAGAEAAKAGAEAANAAKAEAVAANAALMTSIRNIMNIAVDTSLHVQGTSMRGGDSRNNKGKWESTGRVVTTKSGVEKVVFINSVTMESRVRKMVIDKVTRRKKATYVRY